MAHFQLCRQRFLKLNTRFGAFLGIYLDYIQDYQHQQGRAFRAAAALALAALGPAAPKRPALRDAPFSFSESAASSFAMRRRAATSSAESPATSAVGAKVTICFLQALLWNASLQMWNPDLLKAVSIGIADATSYSCADFFN